MLDYIPSLPKASKYSRTGWGHRMFAGENITYGQLFPCFSMLWGRQLNVISDKNLPVFITNRCFRNPFFCQAIPCSLKSFNPNPPALC